MSFAHAIVFKWKIMWLPIFQASNLQDRSTSILHPSVAPLLRESCRMASDLVVHNGGCHCRSIKWQVQAPPSIVAWQCNCSDCSMRGNTHFIVPSERFELLGDSRQFLTTYTFGTHTAQHTFCKVCGITSFYIPRSNPDGIAVNFRCVDPGTLIHIEIKFFDGQNWENSYDSSAIASCSKGLPKESK